MAGKQRPDFSTREPGIIQSSELGHRRKFPWAKKVVGTTARFKNWTNKNTVSPSMHKGPTTSPKVLQYPLKFPRPPTPSNPIGVISIKDDPDKEDTPMPNPKQPFQNGNPIPTKPRSELKRKVPENNNQQQQQRQQVSLMDSLVCEVCATSCSSARTMQQHLNGRAHKAKLEWSRRKRNGNAMHMCDVCGIWCTDKDGLAMHFKGQKHKSKLRVGPVDNKPIMCELCGVTSMNQDLFGLHLKGRQHVSNQQRLKHWGME